MSGCLRSQIMLEKVTLNNYSVSHITFFRIVRHMQQNEQRSDALIKIKHERENISTNFSWIKAW